MHSRRRSHLLTLGAALLLDRRSADAFSLIQNAAASTGGDRDAAGADAAGVPLRSGSAASSVAANPFRGSLNGRRSKRRGPSARAERSSSDDFALRMGMQPEADVEGESRRSEGERSTSDSTVPSASDDPSSDDPSVEQKDTYERRKFLQGMLATTAAGFIPPAHEQSANAYEQAYPLELRSTASDEVETPYNSLSKLKQEQISTKKARVAASRSELSNDPLGLSGSSIDVGLTVVGASAWALALWLASGSRSNPVVTPLANVLYSEEDEAWLSDRNDGYFADVPPTLTAVLSAVFVLLGVVLDRAVYFLADGDAGTSIQLAGVSVVAGTVWEVGRLANGEKAPTREESERHALLKEEFGEFASKRLLVGKGSCHRSDVIAAFRRYNPKYRTAESTQYPLADIEVERLLREWNRVNGSQSEMSSAGFFAGISVDGAADAFAPR